MPRHEPAWRTFQSYGGQWRGKTSPRPTPTHLLVARTPVYGDGGRNRDAPLEHFVLCDTGFNCSWSCCTRRCEVLRIGDRDYADQIRVIQVDVNSQCLVIGAVGYPVNASGLTESVCVSALEPTCKDSKLTTDVKEL